MGYKTIRLSIIICLLTILSITAGCSSSKESSYSPKDQEGAYYNTDNNASELAVSESKAKVEVEADNSGDSEKGIVASEETATALIGTGQSNTSVVNPVLDERKIIRNANISIEVDNFDKAYGMIDYIINGIGYIQEAKINKNKHNIDSKEVLITNGVVIIRIDSEKFNSVLKDIKGLGIITEENIKTDDVTEKFFDIESRLRLLKYEQSRLEEYLLKISDPDIIFKTESRLTQIRHEIEGLTGTINKLGNLVKLSTITINMNEKFPISTKVIVPEEESYWIKLSSNFINSMSGVINFCGEALIFFVSALPILILLSIILFAVVFLYKKFFKNKIKIVTTKKTNTD